MVNATSFQLGRNQKSSGGNVDLSEYMTETEIQELLNNYLTRNELNQILGNYYTKTEIDDLLGGKADKSDLEGLMKLSAEKSLTGGGGYGLPAEALESAMSQVPENAVICRSEANGNHVGNGDYEYSVTIFYRTIIDLATQ